MKRILEFLKDVCNKFKCFGKKLRVFDCSPYLPTIVGVINM
jgi:hypothetical protein